MSSDKIRTSKKTDDEWVDLYADIEQHRVSSSSKSRSSKKKSPKPSSRDRDIQPLQTRNTQSSSSMQPLSKSEHGRTSKSSQDKRNKKVFKQQQDKRTMADDTISCHPKICADIHARKKSSEKERKGAIVQCSSEEKRIKREKKQKQEISQIREKKQKQEISQIQLNRSTIQRKKMHEEFMKQKQPEFQSSPKCTNVKSIKKLYDEMTKGSVSYTGKTSSKYLNNLFGAAA